MKPKHTPGPWNHAKRGDYDTSGIGIFAKNKSGMNYYVAEARFMGTADSRFAEANARLIAAAPELLEALKWAVQQIEDDLDLDHQKAMDACLTAIAKAEWGAA